MKFLAALIFSVVRIYAVIFAVLRDSSSRVRIWERPTQIMPAIEQVTM